MKQETKILSFLITIAFVVRILVLWISRPEFVGWFNHTYYYYVETKGLLQDGHLPFPDMPLLFYLYAATSKLLTWFGIELNTAIVISIRFWMSLIPSLLPIPIYHTFKSTIKERPLPKWIWVLIFATAFYPLTILHMPEFLQKNMLGMLLLAFFIWQSKSLFNKFNIIKLLIICFLFISIILTHYGTSAVTLLYLASISIVLFIHKSRNIKLKILLGLFLGLSITLVTFYFLDIQRFNRIGYYIDRVFDSSSLGLLFSASDPDKFTTLFMLLVPLILVSLLFKWYKSVRISLGEENSLFWLACIIFSYSLILPIYEPLLMARFVNYLGLPIIFILAFLVAHYIKKTWQKRLVLGVVITGILTVGFGDIISSFWHNKNKDLIYEDIVKMDNTINFTTNDLIITRNGVEHISNWFLNTKSSLITSFNVEDLNKYDRVFLLNPTKGAMRLPSNTNKSIQWYNYMLSNIQIPSNAKEMYISEHIELYVIESRPKEWSFDEQGNWINYQNE